MVSFQLSVGCARRFDAACMASYVTCIAAAQSGARGFAPAVAREHDRAERTVKHVATGWMFRLGSPTLVAMARSPMRAEYGAGAGLRDCHCQGSVCKALRRARLWRLDRSVGPSEKWPIPT